MSQDVQRSRRPSSLQVIHGRPSIIVDGRRLTAIYSETFPKNMHRRNRQMAEAGVEVFLLIVRGGFGGDHWTSFFWRDAGVYGDDSERDDGLSLDAQAEAILDTRPDAYFVVRWSSAVPEAWRYKHPDELQRSEKGVRREASYASRLAAEGRAEMARHIVHFAESRPWADRLVGYMPFGQDEGTHHLAVQDAMFDQSPAMTRAFRAYLKQTYETDAALAAAWNDPDARIETVQVPADRQWHAARDGWMHWPEPRATRLYRDYFLAMRAQLWHQRRTELGAVKEATGRPTFVGTDALKQPMFGWLHNDAFMGAGYGAEWRNILLASGSIDVGPMLDMPELDCLITPADYTARSVGFGWDAEGIGDSLVLRGKTVLIEDDARSWATAERETQGAWRTVTECRAGLLRNLALGAGRGHIPYWMNVGGGYFDDPRVLEVVAEQVPVRQRLLTAPFKRTQHAIAMIIDDESPLHEDFTAGFQHLAVLRQRTDHLGLTGLPYRTFLFSDIERDDLPHYRCYLFPNLFRLSPDRIDLIRRRLMRDGSMLIFGPGTGISDGSGLSSTAVTELLGFPLELVGKESARHVLAYGAHPALSCLSGTCVYGDSFVYGPILQPAGDTADHGAVELGKVSAWWECNRGGLMLKEHGAGAGLGAGGEGDCAVVFSMATPIPAAVLRSLALYAGCNPWSELGDVVAACDSMVAVHTMRPGRRTVRLPRVANVVDAVTQETVATQAAEFLVDMTAPDTRVFLIE